MRLFNWYRSLSLVLLGMLIGLVACHRDTDEFSHIASLSLQLPVPYLNADSASHLPITYTILDKAGQPASDLLPSVQLYVNGVLASTGALYYATTKPGISTLQARLGALTSPPVSITARSRQTYPVVRLPVVFHLAKSMNAIVTGQQLKKLIDDVNAMYRNQRQNPDPNNADSFIEFYLASNDPEGNALSQPGLNPLDFDDPATNAESGAKVDSVLRRWCIKEYASVFVKINWQKGTFPPGYSFSYISRYPTEPYAGDLSCDSEDAYRAKAATMIYDQFSLVSSTVAHEFGHMLGLRHTFANCVFGGDYSYVLDTPKHEEARPDNAGYKVSCKQINFLATNVMDYYNNLRRFGFTHDQVALMRTIINHPVYLPIKGLPQPGSIRGRQGSRPTPTW